jgi:hypothetical protein
MLTPSAAHPHRTAATSAASASRAMKTLAALGYLARGITYFLIGVLALAIATGKAAPAADRTGALQFLAQQHFGRVLLWLLVIGFAAMALWRFAHVYFALRLHTRHHAEELQSLARGVLYTVFFFGTLHFVQGASAPASSDQNSRDFTAQALSHTGGRALVFIVGAVIAAAGLYMAWKGITKRFLKSLTTTGMSHRTLTAVTWLGTIGNVARGVLFAALGGSMIDAAVRYRPSEAKGTDSVLRSFAHTAFGPVFLIVVAIGLALFGVYSACEARWHRS